MTQPVGERCDLCRFEVAGACHFNPPSHDLMWPTVKPDDWCGHFKAGPVVDEVDEVAEAFDQFENGET